MTPKEKAEELYEKYCNMNSHCDNAKECALIAVNLRIEAYTTPPIGAIEWAEKKEQYWQEVKQEIEQL